MPRKLLIAVLLIVVIPVTMTGWKIKQYAEISKNQVFELHRHIVHALTLNTNTYFRHLNMRLAFVSLLGRTSVWAEQFAILNNGLMANNDFAAVTLLDSTGKERAKAYDASLNFLNTPIDYSQSELFKRVNATRSADTGLVYEKNGASFFDILYPLENGSWVLVSVRWEALKKLVFDQQVGEQGFLWLLDESGRIVGDSQEKRVGRKMLPQWKWFEDRVSDKEEWSGEFKDIDRNDLVGAGSWVSGAGWFILSAQPQLEAYAKIRELRRSAFFWILVSFLSIGIFIYFWINFISLPITKLSQGVINVTQRKFDQAIPENFGLQEFRALGQAFNRMIKELKSYEDLQVEKIIEEHTTVQSLLFSMRDGILMLDEEGRIMLGNEPARQWAIHITNRKNDFGKAWQSLQEYPPWMDTILPVIQKEKPLVTEEFEFPVQGRSNWARVTAQEVLTEKGRRLGVMIGIRDITQDKELDKMKEDFFNGITHDLRTPLAATIGYLGLSEMQVPAGEEELATMMNAATQSAKRALSLVETILSLARLQAGKLTLAKAPVQARAILSRLATQMSFHANSKKITLTYECEDEALWVNADPSMIERVIENLTGNAIKYTMEKGWVKLGAIAVPEGVEIYIQDNGRGIPKEAMQKLFGQFNQVKAEDRSVGFGIGLSFSKGIVEAHGSNIVVESEVGKGSRFSFIIERVTAPQQAAA